MLKLYKQTGTGLHYWETWQETNQTAIVHWGLVGERGHDKQVKAKPPISLRAQIQQEIDQRLDEGYAPVEAEEHHTLLIEFSVNGVGTAEDLAKRARLQERLNETLG